MNIEHLVKMANQIGAFFAAEPDREQAAREVASHLRRFWERRMREAIIAHLRNGGGGLDDVPRRAVELLASESAETAKS